MSIQSYSDERKRMNSHPYSVLCRIFVEAGTLRSAESLGSNSNSCSSHGRRVGGYCQTQVERRERERAASAKECVCVCVCVARRAGEREV